MTFSISFLYRIHIEIEFSNRNHLDRSKYRENLLFTNYDLQFSIEFNHRENQFSYLHSSRASDLSANMNFARIKPFSSFIAIMSVSKFHRMWLIFMIHHLRNDLKSLHPKFSNLFKNNKLNIFLYVFQYNIINFLRLIIIITRKI